MKQTVFKFTGIEGRLGKYYVDRFGNVYTVKPNEKMKKLAINGTANRGYKAFMVNHRLYYVHRVMYETFIGEIPDGLVIDHIDEVKSNNRLNNLQVLSHSDNLRKHYKIVKALKEERV